jgi:hypothetical protein
VGYPVLVRWSEVIARRVHGLGGDPNEVTPSQLGIWTGGTITQESTGPGGGRRHEPRIELTGKVSGVRYDRFGDFEGFDLRTEAGEELWSRGREEEIEDLVRAAWRERTVISVFVDRRDDEWPSSIVLRRPAWGQGYPTARARGEFD